MEKESFYTRKDPHLENNPENVRFWLDEVTTLMKDIFKVDNLSNNELFIIKKITEDVLNRVSSTDKVYSEGSDAAYGIDKEIISRFFLEAYGFNLDQIDKNSDSDEEYEQYYEYIRRMREKAHLI